MESMGVKYIPYVTRFLPAMPCVSNYADRLSDETEARCKKLCERIILAYTRYHCSMGSHSITSWHTLS